METKKRLAYLDNLRAFVIVLVIGMHAAVTYSGMGGWYYREGAPEKLNTTEMVIFGAYQSFTQAWFMGALFFIAGFFAASSLRKRGAKAFMKERLRRLGVPLLFFMLVINPILFLMIGRNPAHGIGGSGPLWFAEALLIFCAVYAAVRHFRPAARKDDDPFAAKNIFRIILITGIIAFVVRLVFPIGSDVSNLQFAYFPSYVALFVLGVTAGEREPPDSLVEHSGIHWLRTGIIVSVPLWAFIMLAGGALDGETLYNGGLTWQSFLYSLWEAFTAVMLSFGFIRFFKRRVNNDDGFFRAAADNSFGVYVFHAPVLVGVSLSAKAVAVEPVLKAIAAAAVTYFLTLSLVWLFRTAARRFSRHGRHL